MNVGKNANKGGGYHGNLQRVTSLAAVILISQWRIKNTKELTLNQNEGVSKNEEASGRGRTKGEKLQGNSKQATRAKLPGNGLNAHAKCDHLLTTGNLPVNYDN